MIRRLLAAGLLALLAAVSPARAEHNAPVLGVQLPQFTGPCRSTTAGTSALVCDNLLAAANTWGGVQTFSQSIVSTMKNGVVMTMPDGSAIRNNGNGVINYVDFGFGAATPNGYLQFRSGSNGTSVFQLNGTAASTYKNTLDDGAGNAAVAGVVTASGGSVAGANTGVAPYNSPYNAYNTSGAGPNLIGGAGGYGIGIGSLYDLDLYLPSAAASNSGGLSIYVGTSKIATFPASGIIPQNSNGAILDTTANSQNRLSHVANAGALASWTNTAFPVHRDDIAPATYNFVGAVCGGTGTNGVADVTSCINSTASGVTGSWNLIWTSVGNVANVAFFGAICDGGHATQDTAAFLAAAATGKNVYDPFHNYCNITSPIILPSTGQRIYGDGPQASKILAYTQWGGTAGTFTGSVSTSGLLTVTALGTGPAGLTTALGVNGAITGLSGANNLPSNVYITALGTGTGGTGTYQLSASPSAAIASESMYSAPLGYITLSQPAQEVRGLQVSFNQPSSPANRAALTTYPAAIMARQPATVLEDIFIPGGTTCIDMGGNTNAGNSYLYDIDTGCYDYGIRVDGTVDTVRIRAHHHYPFQMSSAQQAIFFSSANVGIDIGRLDDYAISDSLCLGTVCINLRPGVQGSGFGTATNFDFDGAIIGIQMLSANAALEGSALTFSSGASNQSAIVQTAGRLTISSSSFFKAAATVMDSFTGGMQTITGSEWNDNTQDSATIVSNCSGNANGSTVGGTATACRLTLTGNTVERDPATAFNNPWLSAKGNEVVVGNSNSVTAATTTGRPFVSITNDTNGNRWSFNSSVGWSNYVNGSSLPNSLTPTAGGGIYAGN